MARPCSSNRTGRIDSPPPRLSVRKLPPAPPAPPPTPPTLASAGRAPDQASASSTARITPAPRAIAASHGFLLRRLSWEAERGLATMAGPVKPPVAGGRLRPLL